MVTDRLVGGGPPVRGPEGVADRVRVGEAGVGGGPYGLGSRADGVRIGARGRVGRLGGGVERVGRLAGRRQRRVQVGRAAELVLQGRAMSVGTLAGLGGLTEFGLALLGQLGEALVRGGDVLVQGVERGLEFAEAGSGLG